MPMPFFLRTKSWWPSLRAERTTSRNPSSLDNQPRRRCVSGKKMHARRKDYRMSKKPTLKV